jgi:hypothetical protein
MFLLGFVLGFACTFLLLGYGWHRMKRELLVQSLAAERLAYSAGVMAGRQEAMNAVRDRLGLTPKDVPPKAQGYMACSRGMN